MNAPATCSRTISMAEILQAVSTAYKIPVERMTMPDTGLKDTRAADRVRPRHAAMYLSRKLNPNSPRHTLSAIGRRFGGRDHTSVRHAVLKIDVLRTRDPELAGKLEEIEWGLLA